MHWNTRKGYVSKKEVYNAEYDCRNFDRLVSDSVIQLNDTTDRKEVYCFTKEQLETILRLCKYKVEYKWKDGYCCIKKVLNDRKPILNKGDK